MKEIDDRGPEFALLSEPVKGGKHHKKIGIPMLLGPLLAVAAAGLITLAILADSGGPGSFPGGSGGYPGGLPQPPVIQKVDPPEEPEKPEEPEEPEEPESPPPTTPPPTTPPPTTPPPTTPPPTTPPPTTPPPVYYPYEPEEPEEPPAFQEPSLQFLAAYDIADEEPAVSVYLYYEVNAGSASALRVTPISVTQGSTSFTPIWSEDIPPWVEIGDGEKSHTFEISPADEVYFPRPLTVTVSVSYRYDGVWTDMGTQTVIVPYSGV